MAAPIIPLYTGIVPNRNQSANDFADNADDWLTYQAPLATDYNNLATYLDVLAISVDGVAADAQVSADDSAASAVLASNSASLAQSTANFKGLWINLTGALSIPSTVEHNNADWKLLVNLADVTLSEPSAANSDWSQVNPNKVQPQIGGGTLSVSLPNEIQDAGTYLFPLANSVADDFYIDVEKPDLYKTNQPLLQRSGSDLIEYSGGTDTNFRMSQTNSEKYRFTSNGVNKWRF